ncbi:MAG: hypothetical protein HY545_01285 [Candidatus Doudnabacteria bacterium]|nr:hypothetical protein [Candidatus Doudnabacteria bacterium]
MGSRNNHIGRSMLREEVRVIRRLDQERKDDTPPDLPAGQVELLWRLKERRITPWQAMNELFPRK